MYPELVTHTASGDVQTVKYHELIALLLYELQPRREEFRQTLHSQAQAIQRH